MSDTFHFLGMTKATYTRLLLAVVTLIVISHLFLAYRQQRLIEENTQAHAALCVLKADYQKRVADTETYLKLTPAERTAKYGKGIGEIPNSALNLSLHNLQANVKSLSPLHC